MTTELSWLEGLINNKSKWTTGWIWLATTTQYKRSGAVVNSIMNTINSNSMLGCVSGTNLSQLQMIYSDFKQLPHLIFILTSHTEFYYCLQKSRSMRKMLPFKSFTWFSSVCTKLPWQLVNMYRNYVLLV